ncbi:MarR family transcriptional regulator [Nocardioides mangrovicus]|uniref:MarR family transcriptional regulator n=1 Tax=Nocardioides mangrovicus TaxID=2478913 RepID=A0A3L8P562_9ACTN|nr:MarR family transcriptional regulator [Nocardioides mangrovicus]RLV50365.1 MarR family transcriptional regulator [Nocardioides mangrovicus]
MTATEPTGRPLDRTQLRAYFALTDVAALLRHGVEHQLREAGDLTFVQFQLLAILGLDSPTGSLRMTELADRVVFSRSGLTYQAGLMEKAGLLERGPSPDDDRGVLVTITDAGRERLARVLPGHVDVLRELLFAQLNGADVAALATLLEPVLQHMRAGPPRSAATRRRRRGGADEGPERDG